jgi:hypothetical protein
MSVAADHENLSDLFRAVNERILDLGTPESTYANLVCECANEACTHVLRMTPAECEVLRAEPHLYAVVPGHDRPASEEVVRRTDRFVLVRAVALQP